MLLQKLSLVASIILCFRLHLLMIKFLLCFLNAKFQREKLTFNSVRIAKNMHKKLTQIRLVDYRIRMQLRCAKNR